MDSDEFDDEDFGLQPITDDDVFEHRKNELEMIWPEHRPMLSDDEIRAFSDEEFDKEFQERLRYSDQANNLITCPEDRARRSVSNRKIVLDWLRSEPYSTANILHSVLGRTRSNTYKILGKMVKEGLVVHDNIKWMGSKFIGLYGVSKDGLCLYLDSESSAPKLTQYYKRGKHAKGNMEHCLHLQWARLYLQRLNNEFGEERPYLNERDFPGHTRRGDKRWHKRPDGIVRNVPMNLPGLRTLRPTVAIEIERSGKGLEYGNIVRNHLINTKKIHPDRPDSSKRYDVIMYFSKDVDIAKSLEIRFHKIIDDSVLILEDFNHDFEKIQQAKSRFIFDTYEGLPQRVAELDVV